MYSYEDRIRAVRLYIKLGKRPRASIVRLGYPRKNALKNWHREYEQSQELAGVLGRLTTKSYTVLKWRNDENLPTDKTAGEPAYLLVPDW